MENTKQCKKCQEIKPLELFSKLSKSVDGKQPNCKLCNKIVNDIKNKDIPYFKHYQQTHMSKYQTATDKHHSTIPAAVYGIYNLGELIYIGSTKKPVKRKIEHFTSNLSSNCSNIAPLIAQGILLRDELEFKILNFVGGLRRRRAKEKKLIKIFKPILNIKYNTDNQLKST
jgi:hypothetical protein